jgi:YbbR domain-containing protein
VRGLREEIGQVERSLEAYVICRGLGPGRHVRPVQVRTPGSVNLVGVRPSEVTVVLEEVIGEGRRVDLDLRGEPPAGYQLTGVDAEPKVVKVSGARSTVERVSRARATVDLARAVPEVPVSLPVEVVDGSGKVVEGVEVDPERVNVLAGLKLVVSSRTVPVVVQTRGALPENVKLTSVQVEPAMVTIMGPANRVQAVGQIDTEVLTLDRVTKSFTDRLRLVVPEEVNLLTLTDLSVKVTVKVTAPQPAAPPQGEAGGQSGG